MLAREVTESDTKAAVRGCSGMRRKQILRYIMLEGNDPAKVFHAAVRWYGMRRRNETDPLAEIYFHRAMMQLLAGNFSPEWIAREFPATKEYNGAAYGCKDYYSSMAALAGAEPFNGDTDKARDFLWNWYNPLIMEFVVAEMTLLSEFAEEQGKLEGLAERPYWCWRVVR